MSRISKRADARRHRDPEADGPEAAGPEVDGPDPDVAAAAADAGLACVDVAVTDGEHVTLLLDAVATLVPEVLAPAGSGPGAA